MVRLLHLSMLDTFIIHSFICSRSNVFKKHIKNIL